MNPSHEYAKYTGHGWQCMTQHTDDEQQPILHQPAKPDTEGKLQIRPKRSIMVSARAE